MKNILILSISLLLHIQITFGQNTTESSRSGLYLGQTPPDKTPQVFAPGLISLSDRYEFGSTFSKDGKEFYFGVDNNFNIQEAGRLEIWYTKLQGDNWTEPEVLLTHPTFTHNDPMLSPDESRLYFISNRPLKGNEPKDIDIWYIEKRPYGWSKPRNAGATINSSVNEYYASFTSDGALYFSSNVDSPDKGRRGFDIYKAPWRDGEFQQPEKLPATVNSEYYEADVYVAPDESYLIFCAARRGGFGNGDLYISFQNEKGQWTEAKNMGTNINNEGHQLCPFVSYDGKYLFYTSNKEIYWVSIDILDEYR